MNKKSKKVEEPESELYFCEECEEEVLTEIMYNLHLESKTHKMNVRILRLTEALETSLDVETNTKYLLESMTTDEFSHGKDARMRDELESNIDYIRQILSEKL